MSPCWFTATSSPRSMGKPPWTLPGAGDSCHCGAGGPETPVLVAESCEWEGRGEGRKWEKGLGGEKRGSGGGRLEESPGSGMGRVSVSGAIATIHASPLSKGPPAC